MQNDEFRKNITIRATKFAIQVIQIVNLLPKTPAGYAIASQIIRSATSIGANLNEAQSSPTKKDFIHCVTISLKEARETEYWLIIISQTLLKENSLIHLLLKENDEIIRVLVAIIKNSKKNSSF